MEIGAFDLMQFWHSLSMTFVSGYFLILVALVIFLYYLLPLKSRWIGLLVGSILFCLMAADLQIVLIPCIVTFLAYLTAIRIEGIEKKQKKKRRLLLTIVVIVLVGALSIVKVIGAVNTVTGVFVFPVGISYYTFSLVGYLADVYWGKEQAEKNYFKLLLFTLYFPKMLQGPISKHRNLAPQLNQGNYFDYREFCFGMQLVVWGYFKKMVVADRIYIFTSAVFGKYVNFGGAILFLCAVLSAFQLYCDFSGCIDIARGISQMLGIQLEKNFDRPFSARSAAEFWRRWHMSLGNWFKDYVLMPLAISPRLIRFSGKISKKLNRRAGKIFMTCFPTLVVWLLTGLWHGTGLNYVIWGLYWATIMIFSSAFAPEIGKLNKALRIRTDSPDWKAFQTVRTFLLFCVGRVITANKGIEPALKIFEAIFTKPKLWQLFDGTLLAQGLIWQEFMIMIAGVLLVWFVGVVQGKRSIRETIARRPVVIRSLIYALAFVAILVFGIYGANYDATAFTYANF